jgi:ADP-heptose:LPS heptosyltransferase
VRILVIKHGALGDIVLAFPAFAAIRSAWPAAKISLLTTAPFAGFMELSPWFDMMDVDARPEWWQLSGLLKLRRQLRRFDLVYDLQTSGRSSRYFGLAGRPEWSGIAKGCRLPHANPKRESMHTRERLADQLAMAGIADWPAPELAWADADVSGFRLPEKFAVLAPGAAPHRPAKRWPEEKFAALAAQLRMPVVVLGGAAEAGLAVTIRKVVPGAIDLTGKTSLAQLAAVIRRASLAVGNDTGPMHIAAAFGVPSVVLFSEESDPALTAPRYPDGSWPKILRAPHLSGLPVAQVVAALP